MQISPPFTWGQNLHIKKNIYLSSLHFFFFFWILFFFPARDADFFFLVLIKGKMQENVSQGVGVVHTSKRGDLLSFLPLLFLWFVLQ